MTRRALALLLVPLLVVALGAAVSALLGLGLVLFGIATVLVLIDSRSAPGPAAVHVERRADRLFSVGAANPVTLSVRAPHTATLLLRDDAPAAMLASAQYLSLHGAGERTYTLTPRARGESTFGHVHVRSTGPWGLGTRDFRAGEPLTVRVDADISAVRVYEALARRGQLEELGVRTLRRHGEGTEFERVREAVPDDPLRYINWRATARTGRLMATELSPERDQPVIACLDHGRLMGVGAGPLTKFDHAINAALLLLHVALRTGDRAGLVAFADGVTATVEPRTGRAQLRRLLDAIAPLQPGEIESDYAAALTEVRVRQRRRALIAIFTDIVDRDQAAALIGQCTLLRRRHLPLVITVRDPAVVDIARSRPRTAAQVYARAVAAGIDADRADALRLLRAGGVDVIDADARTLSPRLVNRYLELKRRAAL
ncbi:MAG: DUF58 domain-containing protein [Candidatus Dormibacteraeota bacterium]|uniref:DUF58 domain-containing protein n=1 Tax=Candidatus Aeolococcus gillhamiae TaxID=3127015 RepID=A0A934NBI4_9BACT|nr:DUF58 domain-containing protein [Candidatus Dormibacteraeota bacterium]